MKEALRAQARQARAAGGDAQAVQAHLARFISSSPEACIAAYWPIHDEIDPLPALTAHQGPICLPVVVGRARPLVFRRWAMGEPLESGAFGTAHPPPSAPQCRPDLVIVPLLGFDAAGNRLGYGGGFYDRSLAQLRDTGPVLAIGLAYDSQKTAPIPAESTDMPLDGVITQSGLTMFARSTTG